MIKPQVVSFTSIIKQLFIMQLKSYISVQLVFLFFLQNVHCINLQNQHILLKIYNLKNFPNIQK